MKLLIQKINRSGTELKFLQAEMIQDLIGTKEFNFKAGELIVISMLSLIIMPVLSTLQNIPPKVKQFLMWQEMRFFQ